MNLLSDVNLDEITFGKDGKSLRLSFIDMNEGDSLGELDCSSVYSFDHQNCFEDDDSLAAYAGEVSYKIIEVSEISDYLKKSGYAFSGDELINSKLFVISIDGGEVSLKVVCGAASFENEELK
ncbi:hypothetical protein N480_14070 [Pseudoalteromonas luteoviolacea S2607]|uniref:hypothetical protein n=1 Tax=Pseudoalteromonas luteoviolacea TaxID=43657 RepID=UPI0007B04EFC|nr:hypothetical protein [Pseudoalteromonas luteoviolacea]KZN37865.1 hypothetical protein N480_14070 [Pseudoalteromonas luteoviolacea S2607]